MQEDKTLFFSYEDFGGDFWHDPVQWTHSNPTWKLFNKLEFVALKMIELEWCKKS